MSNTMDMDFLSCMPNEILVMLLGYLEISELYNLSQTSTRLAGIIAANAKFLCTIVLTPRDLKLPAEVVKKYWNYQSSELHLKSMDMKWDTISQVVKHIGIKLPTHLTLNDCHVKEFSMSPQTRNLKYIRCRGVGGTLDLYINAKNFWFNVLRLDPLEPASWSASGLDIPLMSLFILCRDLTEKVLSGVWKEDYGIYGAPTSKVHERPIKLTVEDGSTTGACHESVFAASERRYREQWKVRFECFTNVVRDRVFGMMRQQNKGKETTVSLAYHPGKGAKENGDFFKIVFCS